MPARKKTDLDLSPELTMLIGAVAERRGLSSAGLIRTVMVEWLQSNESHKISRTYARGKNFGEKAVSVCVSFPESEVERLGNIAVIEGRSRSALIREAIQNYLVSRESQGASAHA